MTTKHTPGPWEWIGSNLEAGRNDVLRVGDDGKEYGMHSAVLFEDDDPVRAQANRDLIAAAPDLLTALQKVMEHNVPLTGNPTHAEQVEFWQGEKAEGRGDADDMLAALAAITKATGAE